MKNIPSLVGFRGVAAYSILLAHIIDADLKNNIIFHSFSVRLAYFSMSLFFVLSGFVIHYNYARMLKTASGVIDFFVARFARLYPLYLLMVVFEGAHHLDAATALAVASHATLTQSWFNTEEAFFNATWSISTEWFFYVGFVCIIVSGVLVRINHPIRFAVLFILITIVTLCVIFWFRSPIVDIIYFYSFGLFYHGSVSAPAWYWLTYYSPWLRFFEFGIGVIISIIYQNQPLKISNFLGTSTITLCIVLIFGGVINNEFFNDFPMDFVYTPCIAIILPYGIQKGNYVTKFLENSAIVWAGEISYSVYLLQFVCHRFGILTVYLLQFLFKGIGIGWVTSVIMDIGLTIVITSIVASLSYRFIEVPARRSIRRKAKEFQTTGVPHLVSLHAGAVFDGVLGFARSSRRRGLGAADEGRQERTPRRLALPCQGGLEPKPLFIGQGQNALEVAGVSASMKPASGKSPATKILTDDL